MARRGTGLTAIFAALSVLLLPLCALACLDAPAQAAATESGHGSCHEGAPAPASQQEPPTHAECHCETVSDALASQASADLSGAAAASPHPPLSRCDLSPRAAFVREVVDTDLPPRDLLLRKSTLQL